MWSTVAQAISQATGREFKGQDRYAVGGGCINQGAALSDGKVTYFVKLNQASLVAMFEAEAAGLSQIAATQTIRVPKPVCWGIANGSAYLVLEWLDLSGRGNVQAWQLLGANLARLHRVSADRASQHRYGWDQNNTIGSTPQINPWTVNWADFFVEHRLGYQFHLARRRGGHFPQEQELLKVVHQILSNHQPPPSLVHGDLWSGNAAITRQGEPVIFDPATYVGDREVDLAMTELFGRFPAEFYHGYDETFPINSGYLQRKVIYNLYHILNHYNLFGSSYQAQANALIAQILRTQ